MTVNSNVHARHVAYRADVSTQRRNRVWMSRASVVETFQGCSWKTRMANRFLATSDRS
jgi:hypothetical protein